VVSKMLLSVMAVPLNPEGTGIGEWLILFSENFEGVGRGMGNSQELCACYFLELLASRKGSLRQKIMIFLGVEVSPNERCFLKT